MKSFEKYLEPFGIIINKEDNLTEVVFPNNSFILIMPNLIGFKSNKFGDAKFISATEFKKSSWSVYLNHKEEVLSLEGTGLSDVYHFNVKFDNEHNKDKYNLAPYTANVIDLYKLIGFLDSEIQRLTPENSQGFHF